MKLSDLDELALKADAIIDIACRANEQFLEALKIDGVRQYPQHAALGHGDNIIFGQLESHLAGDMTTYDMGMEHTRDSGDYVMIEIGKSSYTQCLLNVASITCGVSDLDFWERHDETIPTTQDIRLVLPGQGVRLDRGFDYMEDRESIIQLLVEVALKAYYIAREREKTH